MLTIQRNKKDVKRKGFDERPVKDYTTLEEDYQNTQRASRSQNEDELWGRLAQHNTTEDKYNLDTEYRQDYSTESRRKYDRGTRSYTNSRSSSYEREKNVEDLPLYTTDSSTSMAVKKYNIRHEKKKSNTVGKIIIAAYVAVITLVAALVIVDSTLKTTAAATTVVEEESTIEYIQEPKQASTNWFDRVCDWLSQVAGD